jgi:hypothetical protein
MFEIKGIDKVMKDLEKLNLPDKIIANAAEAGMSVTLAKARANAPVRTGNLRRGIIMVPEYSATRYKKVYRIVFDRAMNSVFQKPYVKKTQENGKTVEKEAIAYYPVSMEYGFETERFGKFEGLKFVHDALAETSGEIKRVIESKVEKAFSAPSK